MKSTTEIACEAKETAIAQATVATNQATIATNQATIATNQATIATDKALETIAARNDTLNTAGYVTGLVNINFVTFLQSGNGHISVVVNDLNVSTPSIDSNGHFLINIA